MNLVMGIKAMTSDDTFDTLKYGHIPINNLIEFAKTKNYDLSNFMYEEIEERYTYNNKFYLLWDTDAYYITCDICKPNLEFDDTHNVTLGFYLNLVIEHEEKRNFPILPNMQEEYDITSRESFINALQNWDLFVQTSIGMILSHRLEIINDLDDIIQREKRITTTDGKTIWHPLRHSNKKEYMKVLDQLPLELANNISKITNFSLNQNEQL